MLDIKKKSFNRSFVAKRKKSFLIAKTIVILITISLLLVFFVWLCNIKYTRVNSLEVIGTKTISQIDIESILKNDLLGKNFFLIPKNSIFFINTKKLEKKLSKEKPEILAVNISKVKLNKLKITIIEREPFSVWCLNREVKKRSILAEEECYFVDKDGLIFKKTSYVDESIYQIYGSFNTTFLLNEYIVDTDLFFRSVELSEELVKKDINIYGMNIDSNNYFEFLVGENYIIKFNPKIDEIFNSNDFIVAYNKKLQEKEGDFSELKYIDMRYKNKALFMFK